MKRIWSQEELIEKLLQVYQDALKEMPELYWLDYLIENDIEFGFCAKAQQYDINCEFICKEDKHHNLKFIYKTPNECESYKEAMETLKFRYNYLKKMQL